MGTTFSSRSTLEDCLYIINMELRNKYIGLQSKMKDSAKGFSQLGDYGCLFLCLCSIAEEYNHDSRNGKDFDIMTFWLACRSKGLIGDEFFCKDQERMLELATGVKWRKRAVRGLPEVVKWNEYTVEKWYNPRTKYTHFKRRWGDTLTSSVTVKEGNIKEYYVYEAQVKD